MSKIIELPKQRYVNMARNKRKVICMARRIDGKGCQGCAFCGIDNLCIQPARENPAYEGTVLQRTP